MKRDLYNEDHEAFRGTVATFLDREVVPHVEKWEENHLVDRSMWKKAAEAGVIGLTIPEEFGGAGVADFRFEMVRSEEIARRGVGGATSGWGVSDGIVPGYLLAFGTQAQKEKYLPGLAAGESIGAIAMTEPNAGSDLQAITTKAVRDGDDWVINGAKTFITNGYHCDFVIVVARTNPDAKPSQGTSLFIVEDGTPGFERGRKLKKLGMDAQDTSELSFSDVRVPADALLGELDQGFIHLMVNLPTERMLIGSGTLAGARAALGWTGEYVFTRPAFGQTIGDFQNTRFELAELETRVDALEAFVDRCALALNDGELTPVDAAKAKYLGSDLEIEVINRCLQLFGGYGYMLEYPITRAFKDSRVQAIFGGSNEVMKELVGRDIAKRYRQK
ncbi:MULTISPECIES: acyl-CoA dehydrogenase family protein [Brevibacterium]|uniref:Acyl-CoA dehydrogenase, middle domain n=2 Tax=Brevibacterium antiquum TaxID=234835 RepID=A0A2H1JRU9_9MICO|nr:MULTISPECIES: acyl-CoA dehydrogenase family protein [Brevibacterium]SMX90183.1 Acyl-CoA dehydrogenase, middle domain [Brevibacterium antiquum CNRZ 918]SMX99851.1 Acyl-CoA dehydrogenase, middle domain [Brevibacterium antiquum]HCG56622.1 acyl-CoA dehydrogenase [Brevibacterium sp.]